ncbi:MAG TPA: DUF4823 domain-containing protein [Candidatus Sulfotelmatobacter sp.]|jgi:hypothetical protein|nr:DUF4823 domain-containing protein [Candidatus Sulfotelmatobacter sp.]
MWGNRLGAAALIAAALGLAACSAHYQKTETGGIEAALARLDYTKTVLVSIPADGVYGNQPYPGSGLLVAQKTASVFSRYARRVETTTLRQTERDGLLATARKAKAGYVVVPSISHWEQRATEWSGRPSRVSIGVTIIDAESGKDIRSTLLESQSRSVSFTSTNPESLLPRLLGDYVAELYGAKPAAG